MNPITGRAITGIDHLAQSIADILTTPIGSRVMRRDFGFDFDIIDQPDNENTRLRCVVNIIQALSRWEPRIVVERVQISRGSDGKTLADITGKFSATAAAFGLQVLVGAR